MRKENLSKITEFRHELHRHPELSLQETGTIQRIRDFLTENTSLQVTVRDGWLYAVKERTPGSGSEAGALAFRADMDALPIDEGEESQACTSVKEEALPYASVKEGTLSYASVTKGVSHKCGHDGHCAALCGLALELDTLETERDIFLIFQGAEEIGKGAEKAVSLIKEKNIREIYAFHNLSGYPEGEIVYRRGLTQPASEGLTICFRGRQSHASAPEEGINPAELIARTVLYIQEKLKAPHGGMMLCTVVGMEAGSGDFGISAGEGRLMLTLRAENEQDMKELEEEIRSFVRKESETPGIAASFQITDRFPETRNGDRGIERVLDAAAKQKIPAREMKSLWRASEDFGCFLKECEGAMFYIGNGREWPALHTREYDFNDRILETAADMFLTLALGSDRK